AHRDDIVLAGKTGTAEIKESKDDTSGTELGWFAIFTADQTVERPILIVSMVEDVKDRGGSGYVVEKDRPVLEEWFSSN
ncbi:MAG TPA: penicillin-binding transpeptidase domain-containing protein, partial [Lachnospiraceae bacterium]|nr:penicillin-binding transpeptidase domain-containing protein [Lachnospiraceae bacterium]